MLFRARLRYQKIFAMDQQLLRRMLHNSPHPKTLKLLPRGVVTLHRHPPLTRTLTSRNPPLALLLPLLLLTINLTALLSSLHPPYVTPTPRLRLLHHHHLNMSTLNLLIIDAFKIFALLPLLRYHHQLTSTTTMKNNCLWTSISKC